MFVIINSSEAFINESNNITASYVGLYSTWPVLLLGFFTIFGAIGNYLVCCAIIRDHTLQTKTNFYLFSLAISDLAVCLVVAPLAIVKDFLGVWIFSSRICTFWLFLDVLLCTTSIYHLATVSILRFVAIQFPLRNNIMKSKRLTLGLIVLIWIISILVSSNVLFIGIWNPSSVLRQNECYLSNHYFILIGSVVSFVIPLLIMIIMFILMARKLRMQLSKLEKFPNHKSYRKKQPQPSKAPQSHGEFTEMENSNISVIKPIKEFDKKSRQKLRRHTPLSSIVTTAAFVSTSTKKFSYCASSSSISSTQYSSFSRNYVNKPPVVKKLNGRQRTKKNFFYRLSLSITRASSQGPFEQRYELQSEAKALQVLVIVFLTFTIAWLPFCMVNMSSVIFSSSSNSISFYQSLKWLTYLGYLSSTLNPIIYTAFNKKFRKNFLQIIICSYKMKRISRN